MLGVVGVQQHGMILSVDLAVETLTFKIFSGQYL